MKKKDLGNLKTKSVGELESMAGDLNAQIARAKMDMTLHKAKNTNAAKSLKKTLAQVLTFQKITQLNTK